MSHETPKTVRAKGDRPLWIYHGDGTVTVHYAELPAPLEWPDREACAILLGHAELVRQNAALLAACKEMLPYARGASRGISFPAEVAGWLKVIADAEKGVSRG